MLIVQLRITRVLGCCWNNSSSNPVRLVGKAGAGEVYDWDYRKPDREHEHVGRAFRTTDACGIRDQDGRGVRDARDVQRDWTGWTGGAIRVGWALEVLVARSRCGSIGKGVWDVSESVERSIIFGRECKKFGRG